jgi:hypothetical protein
MDKNKQLKSVADAYRQMKLDEQQRLTPQREKVLDKADTDAREALDQSIGSVDPAVKERSMDAQGRFLRSEVLRALAEPEGKRTGAYAGSTDEKLKEKLDHMRKLRTSPEHQQAVKKFAIQMARANEKKKRK